MRSQRLLGSLPGTLVSFDSKERVDLDTNMPKYNCCVPNCNRSHRNATPDLKFYCIPKDEKLRKQYKILLRNYNLKIDSKDTRICSCHWENGEKLSRTHLPTIFPWTKEVKKRREIKRTIIEESPVSRKEKRKAAEIDGQPASDEEHGADYADKLTDAVLVDVPEVRQEEKNASEEEYKDVQALKEENAALRLELQEARIEIQRLKYNDNYRFDIEKHKASPKDIEFYTGLSSYNMLLTCYGLIESQIPSNLNYGCSATSTPIGRPRLLTPFQEFVMVLMRLGLFEKDLAHRFGVSVSTVSTIMRTWIRFLAKEFRPLIQQPKKEIISFYSPKSFREIFPDVVIVVDCTEIEMERPSALDNQSACYSSYKSRPTMKSLVGITPSGVLSYVSDFFPGSTSDREITVQSNFLKILNAGDAVMADKGFNVQDELASVGATLVMPSFLKGKNQFSSGECSRNKAIASLRIHVERLMERIKNWHILDRRMPITMALYASDMLIIIGALSNFQPPLVS